MNRQPIVAGQFYPAGPALKKEVLAYLDRGREPSEKPALVTMVPHAGYIYSGAVAGKTLGRARLADTIVLLGPNHTGRGRRLAVWPDGTWLLPGGGLDVDTDLALAMLQADTRLSADYEAHLGEHCLEVLMPFLWAKNPATRIVPMVVSEYSPTVLGNVAVSLAGVIRAWPTPVSVVVSSDMSHYVSHDTAKELDSLALAEITALSPMGLFSVVRDRGITMCGVLPMTLALFLAVELGATRAEVVDYATSGEVSGDYRHVVGYAGVVVT
ncbi:AmmeMemoRadiSam system protein B [Desulfolutivibrio sulfoxidireducens]|uniref:AmmeMemoRadiSam system protein B n=1 Tax=Desulfolutivibrio sulfoxidireducens TaxID=2773299 RepID=UPI00159E7B11|nr:AmmeMemoRadiSam system protein B [Desulfolutivibrio sulfoxidireducens]QLA16885.1 AmmeMemoRadiSam system protein B [Desulfolutivibrio sulfoxidireducens]QLA20451.1 AmmeMemoRadiSam system protein B [Desulfolutivibrio sulfoxidireducens]